MSLPTPESSMEPSTQGEPPNARELQDELQDELRKALDEHRRALREAAALQRAALRASVTTTVELLRGELARLPHEAGLRSGDAFQTEEPPQTLSARGSPRVVQAHLKDGSVFQTEEPPQMQADLTAGSDVSHDDATDRMDDLQLPPAAILRPAAAEACDREQRSPATAESPAVGERLSRRASVCSAAGSLQSYERQDSNGVGINENAVTQLMTAVSYKATMSTFSFSGAKALKARLKWVRTSWFDCAIAVIIIANAIYLGAQTLIVLSVALEHGEFGESERLMWVTVDIIWAAVFLIEITLRILAYQVKFFTGSQRWWNAFDSFTMLATVVATLFDLLRASNSFGIDLLKVMRIARVVRSLRTSRSRVFHTLRVLSYTVAGSANAFLSAILLLWFVMFAFGIFFMQGLQSYLLKPDGDFDADAKEALVGYFGSSGRTFLTLLQSISGGSNWAEVSESLWDISWFYTWVFVVYIVFTMFCLLNILNGVFVNAAIQSAQTNKELAIDRAYHTKQEQIEQMVHWFVEADVDKSNTVTWEEWNHLLADEKMRGYLNANNIDASSAGKIFMLLDRRGTGEIRPAEFVENLIALQGSASAIDLAWLRVVCDDMAQRVLEMERTVRDAFGGILSRDPVVRG